MPVNERRPKIVRAGQQNRGLKAASRPILSRIATAVLGQAPRSSRDACTASGISSRAVRSNPNRGKKPSAVVVSK
jgi:hypothetical protein